MASRSHERPGRNDEDGSKEKNIKSRELRESYPHIYGRIKYGEIYPFKNDELMEEERTMIRDRMIKFLSEKELDDMEDAWRKYNDSQMEHATKLHLLCQKQFQLILKATALYRAYMSTRLHMSRKK